MWRDIAIANKGALLSAIDSFSEHLARLRQAVAEEDSRQLHSTFSRAKQARDEFGQRLAERNRQTPRGK